MGAFSKLYMKKITHGRATNQTGRTAARLTPVIQRILAPLRLLRASRTIPLTLLPSRVPATCFTPPVLAARGSLGSSYQHRRLAEAFAGQTRRRHPPPRNRAQPGTDPSARSGLFT